MTTINAASSAVEQVTPPQSATGAGTQWLRRSGQFWYLVALIGQIAFFVFIVMFYGTRTFGGDFAGWNDKPIVVGHVEGDAMGNFMFITHVFGATIISLGGMLQLLPVVRQRAPAFHRWLGRSFMVMALLMALGGIMMTWLRGEVDHLVGAVALTIDGALIVIFASIAWRLAAAGEIKAHSRWALRTFMVANAVWFLRLMMMGWAISTGGWGLDGGLGAPAFLVMQFACYLLPLVVLEFYFIAQDSSSEMTKRVVAGVIVGSSIYMAVGVIGAQSFMWGPYYL
jgi:Predicted membrane protein (DUF2306)